MTVSHRAADAPAAVASAAKPLKVARMACCCKLSELLPMVQQLHQQSAARHHARVGRPEAA